MFNKARIKLTLLYLGIIMVISFSFSVVIFKVAENEIERFDRLQRVRIERVFPFPQPVIVVDNSLVDEVKQRLIFNLLLINLVILIISGLVGHFLSGITLRPIKEMLDDQKRFISDASHEINTPLTSLKTSMEVFLRSKEKTLEEANVLVKENINEVNKLQYLSSSLLQLSRYEKVNENNKTETLKIKNVLNNSIKSITQIAKAKKIKINLKSENHKLKGNSYSLENLFTIILENAVKYSSANSIVNINTKKIKNEIEIQISDEGAGIAEKDLPYIFDRFYRADTARTKNKINGYGLGLSIAKKIVDNHQGKIKVKSKLSKGTTFVIRLPV